MAPTNPDLDRARSLFAEAGLPFPAIPAEFVPDFREVDNWHFEANAPQGHPYNLHKYTRLARLASLNNYVVLAHAGHGVNSYAIHYFLVQKPLCVFLQIGWGGVYMDASKAVALLKRCFDLVEELVSATQAATARGRLNTDDRIVVTSSDFYINSRVETRRHGGRWRSLSFVPPAKALESAVELTLELASDNDVQTRETPRT